MREDVEGNIDFDRARVFGLAIPEYRSGIKYENRRQKRRARRKRGRKRKYKNTSGIVRTRKTSATIMKVDIISK